jgi:hypothetical protein
MSQIADFRATLRLKFLHNVRAIFHRLGAATMQITSVLDQGRLYRGNNRLPTDATSLG